MAATVKGLAIAIARLKKGIVKRKEFVPRHPEGYGLISTSVKGTCYDDDYFLWHSYTVELNRRYVVERNHEAHRNRR